MTSGAGRDRPRRRALVLGGGGVTGIAWELGILRGLQEAGVDLTDAETVIGTSAGSVVGVAVTNGTLADAYDAQLAPAEREPAVEPSAWRLAAVGLALARPGNLERKLVRLGRRALAADPLLTPERRYEVIRSCIGEPAWPDADLKITAVEAETGRRRVLDRTSGVDLIDAVAASCAVPLVWAPVPVDGQHLIDGGMASPANADLATGADVVVVVAPIPRAASRSTRIDAQLARTGASRSHIVVPDRAARTAMGRRSLDVSRRAASARAGHAQAAGLAAALADWADVD